MMCESFYIKVKFIECIRYMLDIYYLVCCIPHFILPVISSMYDL